METKEVNQTDARLVEKKEEKGKSEKEIIEQVQFGFIFFCANVGGC